MTELAIYIRQFAHLRRAPGAVWSEATKKQVPHKPTLLLAVPDLVARGVITARQIAADPDVPGFLLTLTGRSTIPPSDRDLWPARHYLAELRRDFRDFKL